MHVANVIRNSPVLVYSAILPDKPFRDSGQGAEFLRKMANLSGSISKRLNNVRNLSATFDRVKVSIEGARGKVRSRELN